MAHVSALQASRGSRRPARWIAACMSRSVSGLHISKPGTLRCLAMAFISQLRRRDASPSLVLLVVCAGVVLASLDLFIVNVALPEIAHDLDAPLTSLSWVLNGY